MTPYKHYCITIRIFFLLVVLILFSFSSFAQKYTLSGKVIDSKGEVIPNASIFIKELKTGCSTNLDGNFNITIEKGDYNFVFSSLGFQSQTKMVNVFEDYDFNVVLKQEEIKLNEVRVYSGGEDPAISIMKNAIFMAPYYRKVVDSYQADVYISHTAKIVKLPKIVKFNPSTKNELKEGDIIYKESINHVEFSQPNHYKQKVDALNTVSTFDVGLNDFEPMDYVNMSIYDNMLDFYSPLTARAFSFYRFQYLGYFMVGDRIVNKIRLIPRNNNPNCFSGELNIFDNSWNVYSFQLENKCSFGTLNIVQTFNNMGNDIYMPTHHKMNVQVNVFGVKMDLDYVTSVKYNHIKYNYDLKTPKSLGDNLLHVKSVGDSIVSNKDPKTLKKELKLQELYEKEELSVKDLLKIDKLTNQIDKAKRDTNGVHKKSLEVVCYRSLVVDSLAFKKDVAYWDKYRPIPLTLDQQQALDKKDSIESSIALKKNKPINSFFSKILNSSSNYMIYKDKEDSIQLYSTGIRDTLFNYFNAIDGFTLWSNFFYKDQKKKINSCLRLGYGFSSKRIQLDWKGTKIYNWKKRGEIFVKLSSTTADFKQENEILPSVDLVSIMMSKENFKRYYRSDNLEFGHQIDLAEGLTMKTSAHFENRIQVKNNIDYFIKDTGKRLNPNVIENKAVTELVVGDSNSSGYDVEIIYTPEQYYQLDRTEKVKRLLHSRYPTFKVGFTQSIPMNLLSTTSKYIHLRGSISQTITSPYENNFSYLIEGGKIWNASHFSEFKSFLTQQMLLSYSPYGNGFMLSNDYALNENDWYLHLQGSYSTMYLLLKYLPGLNNTFIQEKLSVNYLNSSLHHNYVEVGYSLDYIFMLLGAGFYTGFEEGYTPRYGVKLYLTINP